MAYDIFVLAGEFSGDLLGKHLLQSLYKLDPNLKVEGVGGPRMRALGMQPLIAMEEFNVMGFVDPLIHLPKLIRYYKIIKREILNSKPKAVVCIDFPEFNLCLSRALHKSNSKSKRIQYVCPSVSVWRKQRIPKMEKSLDQLLTIFPFEPNLFRQDLLDVLYVGHPLIARVKSYSYEKYWKEAYNISDAQQILSIFPGSRKREILYNLPLQLHAAKRLCKKNPNLLIAISCSSEKFFPIIKSFAQNIPIIDSKHTYELMLSSYASIATSGTITLELALHHIPTIATYFFSAIETFIARKLLRIDLPYYVLPNIIGEREIFPELIGPNLTKDALYERGEEFLFDPHRRINCVENCQKLRKILGEKDASIEAAHAILRLIS